MFWFRSSDRRYPFLWETRDQPPARWHDSGEGPVQYLASTPDGAWAEFLRREEITEVVDLGGIARALWAVEVHEGDEVLAEPDLPDAVLTGGPTSYQPCRDEAKRLRDEGATALQAPSAALLSGSARGQRVAGGLVEGQDTGGRVFVLFGARPDARGWLCVSQGRPTERLLGLVRQFT